jgi:formylglycine-generating enzyme required for sulfatase activity
MDWFPSWSPDGRQILFDSKRDGSDVDIYVMDADGSNVRPLTDDPADDFCSTWQPMPAGGRSDTWIRPTDGMAMIYVPGGTLQMGSDTGDTNADDDEFPQHAVTLDGFWIDRTEVTNAQYALCVADGDCEEASYADDAGFNGDDYPAAGVSWEAAADYCAWAGARLPTEAEWEYAARGTRGYIFPWGDDFDCSRGNFREGCDGYERTAPVGSFPGGASWCGVLDMAGNVWEWVADWDGDYSSEAQTNPTGPTMGTRKIFRGGSFDFGPSYARTTDRGRHYPDGRSGYGGYVGLRCAGAGPRE